MVSTGGVGGVITRGGGHHGYIRGTLVIVTFGVYGVSECCTQINYNIPYVVILVHCIHTGGGGGAGVDLGVILSQPALSLTWSLQAIRSFVFS